MKSTSPASAPWLILLLCLLLSSCVIFRPAPRNELENDLPRSFSLYETGEKRIDRWWKNFASSELDALVEEALGGNLDLRVAWARLR